MPRLLDLLERIGKSLSDSYRVERELGRGGMATVYLAHDIKHDRPVALKVVHEDAAGVTPARFLREIRTAARLQHPHILPVHDSGQALDLLWYTMPYVEGESLRDRLTREGRLPLDQVVRLTREVAEALAYAHGRGVVHRDIKPENILLSQGHALLADFGIAKAAVGTDDGTVTQVGVALGTPAYMSPEQAVGDRDVDHRSDIYSLGCLVYELLAGSPPFVARTGMALIVKHLTQEPPPIPVDGLPAGVQSAVLRALAKEPGRRFDSATELAAALEQPSVVPTGTATAPSVAVLDFANLSGDPAVGWLGTGIAETVTTDLQKCARLTVVGRDRVAKAAAGDRHDAAAIGGIVGADWVVTGSFQVLGDRVRITPRLVAPATGEAVGLDKVDGLLSGVFGLQDQVVLRVLGRLIGADASVDPGRDARPATDTLTAFEHFARGRQLFVQFTRSGFEQAKVCYEQAIAADPGYALAYSGLGSILAYRYIATSRREDLLEAIRHLERARELDAALAEPYLWLAYAYTRSSRFEDAERAAKEAVRRMPDDALAHYLLGGARQTRAATECRWELTAAALPSYVKALALQRLYEPTYLNLGWMYVLNGQYGPAQSLLTEATRLEEASAGREVRFIGAHTLLALLRLRQNQPEQAEQLLLAALGRYEDDDHVYAPVFTALAWFGLGQLHLRRGRFDAAIERLSRARTACESHPDSVGVGYYMVRVQLGLARAFGPLRMRSEEAAALEMAQSLLANRRGYSFDFVWEGGEGQVYYDLASYHAAAGNDPHALEALGKAIECGWRDLPSLAATDFDPLRSTQGFEAAVRRAARYTDLPEPDSLRGRG